MSYSIIAAILLSTIVLSSSSSFVNQERNGFGRFYADYAELYQPITMKTYVDPEQTIERYQFFFTEKEYSHIYEKSLTMLNTYVIERTITFHQMPNFEVNGTRYFYRREPHQVDPIEIELVHPEDLLFREVQKPDRYFYLSSFEGLEYSNQVPAMPYYEVTFICNSSYPKDKQTQSPYLSYIIDDFHYRSRYVLDLPASGASKKAHMNAYVDIRNDCDQLYIFKEIELVSGNARLHTKSIENLRTGSSNVSEYFSTHTNETNSTHLSGEQRTAEYAHKLPISSSITLPPHSSKSFRVSEPNVTIEPYCYYISVFSPTDSNGTLLNAYNLTSFSEFIPHGHLLIREHDKFIGQIDLPDLSFGETYTMIFGYDADITYRRKVSIVEGDEQSDSTVYYVEYVFENKKSARDIPVFFIESFSSFKYFNVKNIATSDDTSNLPDVMFNGSDLRGHMVVPCQNSKKMISYNLIVYKYKPRFYV